MMLREILPPKVLWACGVLVLLFGAGIVASSGAFNSALSIDLSRRLLSPSGAHWLGTDALGRDVLAMVSAGSLASLAVAAAAVATGALAGVVLGLIAAARGGLLSEWVARAGDLIFAFPSVLLAILLSTSLGPGIGTTVIAIAIFNVPVFARLVRGQALSLMQRDFILAARMAGRADTAIAVDHLLPNVAALVSVQVALQMSLAIVAESGLSYIGLGIQPPTVSWGRMLADAQTLVSVAPWLVAAPGVTLTAAVLALNSLADALARQLSERTSRPVP